MVIDNNAWDWGALSGLDELLESISQICPNKLPPPDTLMSDTVIAALLQSVTDSSGIEEILTWEFFESDYIQVWREMVKDGVTVEKIEELRQFSGWDCLEGIGLFLPTESWDWMYEDLLETNLSLGHFALFMIGNAHDLVLEGHEIYTAPGMNDQFVPVIGASPYINFDDQRWSYEEVLESPLKCVLAAYYHLIESGEGIGNPFLGVLENSESDAYRVFQWIDVPITIDFQEDAKRIWDIAWSVELDDPDWFFDQRVQTFSVKEKIERS